MTTKEIVTEYAPDENGDMKIIKQKVNEKIIPPNTDIIKLVYQHYADQKVSYESMTDEELEKEKQRLIALIKEEEDAGRKGKN